MRKPLPHSYAVAVMACAAIMGSMAGVLMRKLEAASGIESTFWRSAFSALFVLCALAWQEKSRALRLVRASGSLGLLSGAMWATMFCCFMLALTKTTVANTLIVMSVAPLLTALFALVFLRQRIVLRTWLAIGVAVVGMLWMFTGNLEGGNRTHLAGMLIAFGVPVAASVNVIAMKKAGHQVDLVPAVFLGSLFSLLAMFPLAWPLQASWHDVGILAVLGIFQLGLPCMMMVIAARSLSAPEVSLLALLEVVFGPVWTWLGANETPSGATLAGGALVLSALVLNELVALKARGRRSRENLA